MQQHTESTAAIPRTALSSKPFLVRLPGELLQFARKKPLGFFGAIVLLTTILMAIFANVIAPYDPLKPDPRIRLTGPTASHIMGTDNLGRDQFSRIVYGARASIQVGVLSLLAGTLVGSLIGLVSGYV